MACRRTEGADCGGICCFQCADHMTPCGGCDYCDEYDFAEDCPHWVEEVEE